jgi:hypothetical protein
MRNPSRSSASSSSKKCESMSGSVFLESAVSRYEMLTTFGLLASAAMNFFVRRMRGAQRRVHSAGSEVSLMPSARSLACYFSSVCGS